MKPPMGSAGSVSGARRAAVLLAAAGSSAAAGVLHHLESSERQAVLLELARMDREPPTPEETAAALAAFRSEHGAVSVTRGGLGLAREVVESLPDGEDRGRALEDLERAMQSAPFGKISGEPAGRIAKALRGESPQTAAMVLASLPPSRSAEVLRRLPLVLQTGAVRRLAGLRGLDPDAARQIERALETKLERLPAESPGEGGLRAVSELLRRVDRDTEEGILQALEAEEPGVTGKIRALRTAEGL